MAGTSFQLLDASVISQLSPNSLTDLNMVMDEESPQARTQTRLYLAETCFSAMAASIAYGKGVRHLVTGVSEADYSGYPDCRILLFTPLMLL